MRPDPLASRVSTRLQHDNTHATHLLLIGQVLVVDATGDGRRAVVVQVEVELTVTGAKLELFEEQRVVVQSESVEDVELGLYECDISR